MLNPCLEQSNTQLKSRFVFPQIHLGASKPQTQSSEGSVLTDCERKQITADRFDCAAGKILMDG